MIKAVIFDLDGTLLYTLDSIAKSTNHILNDYGYSSLETEAYKRIVGNGVKALLEGAFSIVGADKSAVDERVLSRFRVYFKEDRAYNVKAYEGLEIVLPALKEKGIHIACNTNKPQENAKLIISEYFGDIFECIVGQKEGVPKKPDKAGGVSILEHFGLQKEEVLYVGDSDVDMKTASNIGCVSVGALWGYRTDKELLENGADYLAKLPTDILDILFQINK